MKKLTKYFLAFLAIFSSINIPVFALDTTYGIIRTSDKTGVNVRKEPTTSSDVLGEGKGEGEIVTILDTVSSNDNNCPSKKWHKISYNVEQGYGYVCSDFVVVLEADNEFDASLESFPESYRPYLKILHSIYPNAKFVPYDTELDFERVVKGEYDPYYGKSLIWDNSNSRNGLKSLDTYNISTNTFRNNYPGGGAPWYVPNADTIAYYIDPRNFLNEVRVFMFESLKYDSSYYSIDGIETILKGSFMYDAYVDYVPEDDVTEDIDTTTENTQNNETTDEQTNTNETTTNEENATGNNEEDSKSEENNQEENKIEENVQEETKPEENEQEDTRKKFSQVIMEASAYWGINPYYVASRIIQEVGYGGRSSLVLGEYPDYPEYNGYYNFFNIGAGGDNVVRNGLNAAKNNGWDSEEKSIFGGTSSLSSDYVGVGQDTGYFQKWDVVCKESGSCLIHQYMQNIEAPFSEASKTYSGYLNTLGENMYNVGYVFKIPVYDNMPEKTVLPNSANPINYLRNLYVNDNLVNNFNSLVYDYEITIPSYMKKINIKANGVVEGVNISNTGDIEITEDKQIINVVVKALNGNLRTYNIKVNLNDDYELTLDDTITNIKNNIKDDYLYNIKTLNELKESITNVNSLAVVEITNKDGQSTDALATGTKVKITVANEVKEYSIVVNGDAAGDGTISAVDYSLIKNKIMGSVNLNGVYMKAADVNGDGEINAVDYANIKNYIMGNDSVIKR